MVGAVCSGRIEGLKKLLKKEDADCPFFNPVIGAVSQVRL